MPAGYIPQKASGWSVGGNLNSHPKATFASSLGLTVRREFVPPHDATKIKVVYASNLPSVATDNPHTNHILVTTTIEPTNLALNAGSSANTSTGQGKHPVTYHGSTVGVHHPGTLLLSDDTNVPPLLANTRSFINTFSQIPPYPAPSAPSLSATAGAGLANGTYSVGLTIVYPGDVESPCTSATVPCTTGFNQITVDDPGIVNYPGAKSYRVWISPAGTTTPLYDSGKGPIAFGSGTIITTTSTAAQQASTQRRLPGVACTLVNGCPVLGSTTAGGAGNGEFSATGDFSANGFNRSGNTGNAGITPSFVLLFDPLRVHRSFALLTDSIGVGVGDYGFGQTIFGGFLVRSMLNQTTQQYYDPTVSLKFGYIPLGVAGDSAALFTTGVGDFRRQCAQYCTDFITNLGTNDLSSGTNALALGNLILSSVLPLLQNGMQGWITTITPDVATSDAGTLQSNMSWPRGGVSAFKEPNRRLGNNWRRAGSNASVARIDEPMCGVYSGTQAYNANWYRGGDATATTFVSGGLPFVPGTEVVKVNSVTKVVTTDYTYYGQTTVNGTSYACGVIFNSAPGNGLSVTMSYTSSPGFGLAIGYPTLMNTIDITASVEADSTGSLVFNGGLWPPSGDALVSGTSSGSNSTTVFNDTSKTWSQDQYRDKSLVILTDSGNAAAVGLSSIIIANSTTQLTVSLTQTPSGSATYKIFDPYVSGDGLHPAGRAHALESATVAAALPASN